MINVIRRVRHGQVEQFTDLAQIMQVSVNRAFAYGGMAGMDMLINLFRSWMIG